MGIPQKTDVIYEAGLSRKVFLPSEAVRLTLPSMEKILLGMIRAYQLTLSPFIGMYCRFTPTCSRYAAEAIQVHGSLRGSWLAVKRIGRCHPFCDGGLDPVPPAPGTDEENKQ